MSADLGDLVPFLRTLPQRKGRRPLSLPRPVPPTAAERAYRGDLRAIAGFIPRLVNPEEIAGRLGAALRVDSDARRDAGKESARDLVKRLRREGVGRIESVARQTAQAGMNRVDAASKRRVESELRVIRVNPLKAEAGLRSKMLIAVERNVQLIKTIPEKYFGELEDEVIRGIEVGRTADEIAARLKMRFTTTAARDGALAKMLRRIDLIARDQVGKANSDLTQARHENLGINRYRWRTSLDERVRGNPSGKYPDAEFSHYAREGEIYSYDEPPEDGHPGEAVNCRCLAEPVLEDILPDVSLDVEPQAFAFDPLAFLR